MASLRSVSPLLEDKPVTLCCLDLQLLASCSLNSIAEARAYRSSGNPSLSDVGLYHLSSHRAELLRLQAALLVCVGVVRDEGSKEHNSVHQVTGMYTVSARFTTMAVLCSKISIDKTSISRLIIVPSCVHQNIIFQHVAQTGGLFRSCCTSSTIRDCRLLRLGSLR